MLDLVLGALLVVLAIRGWMRGFVKEVISLGVLVLGTILAFRLSTPVGRIFADMSGASPDAARYVAGFAIFLTVAIGAALLSRILHLGMRILPGVSTVNRAAGAALSLIALTLVVTLAVSMAQVINLSDSADEQLDQSSVAAALTDPEGVPQRVLGVLSGDRVIAVSLRLQEMTGSDAAVATPGSPVHLEASDVDSLERLPAAEETMLDLLNRERIDADQDPLSLSSGLDRVAFDHALNDYATGIVTSLDEDQLRSLLNSVGMPSSVGHMAVVLAASPEAAHAALVSATEDMLVADRLYKVGIAVIQGPFGLLAVEILTG